MAGRTGISRGSEKEKLANDSVTNERKLREAMISNVLKGWHKEDEQEEHYV